MLLCSISFKERMIWFHWFSAALWSTLCSLRVVQCGYTKGTLNPKSADNVFEIWSVLPHLHSVIQMQRSYYHAIHLVKEGDISIYLLILSTIPMSADGVDFPMQSTQRLRNVNGKGSVSDCRLADSSIELYWEEILISKIRLTDVFDSFIYES